MTSPLGGQDDDRIRVFGSILPYNNKTGGAFCARADNLASFAWMSFALLEYPSGGSTPWEPIILSGQPNPAQVGFLFHVQILRFCHVSC